MSFLDNVKARVPAGEQLYSLLATAVICAIIIGQASFIAFAVIPRARDWEALTYQLEAAQRGLDPSRRGQEPSTDVLRQEIANAQARLANASQIFANEAQAAGLPAHLQSYAVESGIEIASLQSQPLQVESDNDLYAIRTYHLQAHGALPRLIGFLSRTREAGEKGCSISNLSIAESAGGHSLTMDITFYTSPHAPAEAMLPPAGDPAPAGLAPLEEALNTAWAAGDWQHVIALLEQMRAISPGWLDLDEKLYAAQVNHAHRLLGEGDTDRAIEAYNAALAVRPDGPEAQAGLRTAVATPMPTPTPGPMPTPTPPPIIYTVRYGDTLYSIARAHDTAVAGIIAANGLAGSAIRVGQQLRIPASR